MTSVEQRTQQYLARVEAENPKLNAYLEVFSDALGRAKRVDEHLASGEELPLAGQVIAVKDNILIEGKIASAGSKILSNYVAAYDATVIKKLRAAGAIFLGRTNLDEFAMGSSTENSAFGPSKNPHDLERVPGGSSGGSAAAVAADLCTAALGSDTGGSVRQPASFCGVVGVKPTYGAVSRYGLIALASSLDQIGLLAKTVGEAETIFKVIVGGDQMDATSFYPSAANRPRAKDKMTIGVPWHFLREGVGDEVEENFKESLEKLKAHGYEIVEIELPNIKYSLACYYIIMPAEASANLARYDGMRYGLHVEGENLLGDYLATRGEGFGRETKRRIILGTYVLSSGYHDAYYNKATVVRELIKNDFAMVFKKVDAIALPTTPTAAFHLGEKATDPLAMYLADIFTVPANIAGTPAISVPSGKNSEGLPLGLQLVAPWWGEDIIFKIGKDFERAIS